jgi:hypothetical protein
MLKYYIDWNGTLFGLAKEFIQLILSGSNKKKSRYAHDSSFPLKKNK